MNSTRVKQDATILIIDDSAENRLLLSSQLRMDGYDILQASNGPTGLQMAKQHLPDLILLDVMMPGMNGFQVCAHLKEDVVTALLPVIMVTALREVQYRIQGIEAGADEFLSRPHHREELLVRVRSLVKLKRTRENLQEERNRLEFLYDITRATNTQLDINQMMKEIITRARQSVEAKKGSIFLIDENHTVTTKFLVRANDEVDVSSNVTEEVMQHGLAGWLINNNQGDIIYDTADDERWIVLPDDTDTVGSVIGIPLSKGESVVGVLMLIHEQPGYFNSDHLAIIETIGVQVTSAIENAYLFNEVREQQKKLSTILAKSNDAIFTTDEEQHIALFNAAAENLFGIKLEAIVGLPLTTIPELAPLIPAVEQATLKPVTQEISLDDGAVLYTSISSIPDVGLVIVMQDVTELKQAEAQRLEIERREKALVRRTFARYMGERLVNHVLSHDPSVLERRERRAAVVMFADMRGFTRMIMALEPQASIDLLNQFFSEMTDVVYEFDGTIFDLVGDELMVGFNVPFDQPDANYRSILTAVSMQLRFDQLRQDWYVRLGTELGLGIGIDAGNVIIGNVGARQRMNFAMVGEAVNTAHRFVDMAKDGQIVISEAIHDSLKDRTIDIAPFISLGKVDIPGKPEPQTLYQAHLLRTELPELGS
ncbi:MAG TPA: adenylate/guanylate cyclase domain-containing protein [Anaerolineae bacterium]|nr:adenylate/guanylate cyclase domain-containing protein [Anaerolineae bacterium]